MTPQPISPRRATVTEVRIASIDGSRHRLGHEAEHFSELRAVPATTSGICNVRCGG